MRHDDAENRQLVAQYSCARVNTCEKKRKKKGKLWESTGVVPAKVPPKVKLEIFS